MSNKRKGLLIWITGLPGSGKTTLAKEVYRLLVKKLPTVFMDGDIFREIMGNDLGYTRKDRIKNAFRLARMNHYLVEHGMVVVCATVSLYGEVHAWNRKHIKNLFEVYIDVPHAILKQRDQKGLYSQAHQGTIKNLVGIHQTFDIPKQPDLIVVNQHDLKTFLAHAKIIARHALLPSHRKSSSKSH